MKKTVVSLFDYTGIAVEPWRDAGYRCIIVDIQHPPGSPDTSGGIRRIHADLSKPWEFPGYTTDIAFVFAFPPCDHLAVSGARWFQGKGLRSLAQSIHLFATAAEFCEASGAPYLIENPVSTISSYWQKPDYTFHPYQFTGFCTDDNYTKKTCLWTGGGFVMPEAFQADMGPPDNRIHVAPPGEGRKNFRSSTPRGLARAVFEANSKQEVRP